MLDALVKALQNNLGNVITNELVYGILAVIQNEERSNAINIQDIPAIEYADHLIQVERIEDVLHELKPVHAAHWQETERYRHGIALNPDYNYMINAERSGRFMLFTVRNQSGIVGNCMMYLSRSTHTQRWVAEEDTIFILPEYRKGRLGVRLIRYVEDVLRNMGVTEIRVTVKTVNDVGRLLSHLGYNHTGNQLTKTLE
jgi:GNAT superfamily N-acetyltransferase